MSVTVVIPFGGECPHRRRALEWVVARYNVEHLDWRVVIARGDAEAWSKGAAIAPAIERTHDDVVIVADADVWVDPTALVSAVRSVICGAAEWAIPHDGVFRLTEAASARFMTGEMTPPWDCHRRPYRGFEGGGIVVVSRDLALRVPMDPRFTGWGGEDESWGEALRCLGGEPWRGEADLIHLFHPPARRMSRRWGSQPSRRLALRYRLARKNPEGMEQLIGEFRERDPELDQSAVPPAA